MCVAVGVMLTRRHMIALILRQSTIKSLLYAFWCPSRICPRTVLDYHEYH